MGSACSGIVQAWFPYLDSLPWKRWNGEENNERVEESWVPIAEVQGLVEGPIGVPDILYLSIQNEHIVVAPDCFQNTV